MRAESRNERGGQNLIKRDTAREQGKKKKKERIRVPVTIK